MNSGERDKNFKDQMLWSRDMTTTKFGYLHFGLPMPTLYVKGLKSSKKQAILPTNYIKYNFLCQLLSPLKLKKKYLCTPCSYFTLQVKQFVFTSPCRLQHFFSSYFTLQVETVCSYFTLQVATVRSYFTLLVETVQSYFHLQGKFVLPYFYRKETNNSGNYKYKFVSSL